MPYGYEFYSMTNKVTYNAGSEKLYTRYITAFDTMRLNIPEKIPTYQINIE
jgi:hypothetical protein